VHAAVRGTGKPEQLADVRAADREEGTGCEELVGGGGENRVSANEAD